jgi:putative peptidoglycan lipid II flippase
MVAVVNEEAERRHIAGRAGIVALGTLASRVLGLGRDMALAAYFSRAATDAWLIAFQIPNMLRQLVAEGAVQTSVLPVLSEVRERRGPEAALAYFRALTGLWLVLLVVLSALGMWAAPLLVDLFAEGFRSRPGQAELTTLLTRWAFPYIFFMGLSSLGVAALNARGRFVATSFAPALLNVAFIAFCFGVPAWLGALGHPPILAMAVAALIGGAAQVFAQWPSLRAIGFLTWPRLEFGHPDVRLAMRRLAPSLLGVGVYYVDVIIGRRLLADLGEGAVTYFSYALRLCDFSQGIFVMALSSATLPALAAAAAKRQLGEVSRTFAFSMRHALFVGIPSSLFLVTLAEPIVRVLLGHGSFDTVASFETSRALVAQGSSVFLVAGVRQVVLVYFALGRTRVPVAVAAIDLLVFWGSSSLLAPELGHVGVSWGVTIARVGQFALLCIGLLRILPTTGFGEIAASAARVGISALSAALGSWLVLGALRPVLPDTSLSGALAGLGAGSVTFGVVFLVLARLLGCQELATVVDPAIRRLRAIMAK